MAGESCRRRMDRTSNSKFSSVSRSLKTDYERRDQMAKMANVTYALSSVSNSIITRSV
jgi:hypothetical protein